MKAKEYVRKYTGNFVTMENELYGEFQDAVRDTTHGKYTIGWAIAKIKEFREKAKAIERLTNGAFDANTFDDTLARKDARLYRASVAADDAEYMRKAGWTNEDLVYCDEHNI